MKKIQDDPDRALFCIDWEKFGDQMDIYGVSHYTDFQYIDMELVPCQYLHTFGGWTGDKVTPECLYDKEGAEDYMRNLRAYLYISEQRFEQTRFDDETIKW